MSVVGNETKQSQSSVVQVPYSLRKICQATAKDNAPRQLYRGLLAYFTTKTTSSLRRPSKSDEQAQVELANDLLYCKNAIIEQTTSLVHKGLFMIGNDSGFN